MTQQNRTRRFSLALTAILATASLAACAGQNSLPPSQVSADVPNVTYEYRGDDQLLAANTRATEFCAGFNSLPDQGMVQAGADGINKVRFECNRAIPQVVATLPPQIPPYVRNYRSDQELLTVSQNARTYCMEQGSHLATSLVTRNPDGSSVASFECAPR